mmetsp:Transcript_55464/g.152871  ORF Transcript_55464/g.152871 Transcript_55464/m.152871 type:complete len:237 (+) Transcript_55464:1646-2356(+)
MATEDEELGDLIRGAYQRILDHVVVAEGLVVRVGHLVHGVVAELIGVVHHGRALWDLVRVLGEHLGVHADIGDVHEELGLGDFVQRVHALLVPRHGQPARHALAHDEDRGLGEAHVDQRADERHVVVGVVAEAEDLVELFRLEQLLIELLLGDTQLFARIGSVEDLVLLDHRVPRRLEEAVEPVSQGAVRCGQQLVHVQKRNALGIVLRGANVELKALVGDRVHVRVVRDRHAVSE